MKTLMLLRHAKSSWGDPQLPDHDRPLNARGRDAAARLSRHFARTAATPTLVLCSTAQRARETLERLAPGLDPPPPVRFEPGLYLAEPQRMMELLRALPDEADPVLLIGHNPGIAALANQLVHGGERVMRAALALKYPTGALAVIETAATRWRDLGPGTLVEFTLPRDLPE